MNSQERSSRAEWDLGLLPAGIGGIIWLMFKAHYIWQTFSIMKETCQNPAVGELRVGKDVVIVKQPFRYIWVHIA